MPALFLLSCKEFAFFTKNTKNNHSSAKNKQQYTKSCFKENARTCSKNSTTQGNNRISRLKKRLRNLYQKKFKSEINQLSKIYKMNFTNQKTNKQKVLPKTSRSNTFFKVLKRKNMQNQTRSEFILMIINQNILATLLTFSNLQKNFYERF